jgi:hypothetical protein
MTQEEELMTPKIECPKCVGGVMSEPTFMSAEGSEHLLRRCVICGYTKKYPTKDSDAVRKLKEPL